MKECVQWLRETVNLLIVNPILIKNSYNYEEISERLLKKLIMEDISSFMKEVENIVKNKDK